MLQLSKQSHEKPYSKPTLYKPLNKQRPQKASTAKLDSLDLAAIAFGLGSKLNIYV